MASLIDFGHKLELAVLTDGVDAPEQARFLFAHGADACAGAAMTAPSPLPAGPARRTRSKAEKAKPL